MIKFVTEHVGFGVGSNGNIDKASESKRLCLFADNFEKTAYFDGLSLDVETAVSFKGLQCAGCKMFADVLDIMIIFQSLIWHKKRNGFIFD